MEYSRGDIVNFIELERMTKKILDKETRKELDSLFEGYLEVSTHEHLYLAVEMGYQAVRRTYSIKKFSVNSFEEFEEELTRFIHTAENIYHEKNLGCKYYPPAHYEQCLNKIREILNVTNLRELYKIAQDETRGGIPLVIETLIQAMEKQRRNKYLKGLIDEHFCSYNHNYFANQYIALSYLKKYRPELMRSKSNEYVTSRFINEQNSMIHQGINNLYEILSMHLTEI